MPGKAPVITRRSDTRDQYDVEKILNRTLETIKDDPALLAIVLKDKELNNWWTEYKSRKKHSQKNTMCYDHRTLLRQAQQSAKEIENWSEAKRASISENIRNPR